MDSGGILFYPPMAKQLNLPAQPLTARSGGSSLGGSQLSFPISVKSRTTRQQNGSVKSRASVAVNGSVKNRSSNSSRAPPQDWQRSTAQNGGDREADLHVGPGEAGDVSGGGGGGAGGGTHRTDVSTRRESNGQAHTHRCTATRTGVSGSHKSTTYSHTYQQEMATLNIHTDAVITSLQSTIGDTRGFVSAASSDSIHPLNRAQQARRARLESNLNSYNKEAVMLKVMPRVKRHGQPLHKETETAEKQEKVAACAANSDHQEVTAKEQKMSVSLAKKPPKHLGSISAEVTRRKIYVPRPGIAPYFRCSPLDYALLSNANKMVAGTPNTRLPHIRTTQLKSESSTSKSSSSPPSVSSSSKLPPLVDDLSVKSSAQRSIHGKGQGGMRMGHPSTGMGQAVLFGNKTLIFSHSAPNKKVESYPDLEK